MSVMPASRATKLQNSSACIEVCIICVLEDMAGVLLWIDIIIHVCFGCVTAKICKQIVADINRVLNMTTLY